MHAIILMVVLSSISQVTWALDALLRKLSGCGKVLQNRGPEFDANAIRTGAAAPHGVPDGVSPITAYRAWEWNGSKLKSFNNEHWHPGIPMEAQCKSAIYRRRPHARHQPPHQSCSCGVYAAKTMDQLCQLGYANLGVYGEVYLWGTVVEHSLGWRAQYAYPKRLVLSPAVSLRVTDRRDVKVAPDVWLEPLTEYGADIYLRCGSQDILLWSARLGCDPEGLKELLEVRILSEGEAKAEEEQFTHLLKRLRTRTKQPRQDRWLGPPPSPPAIPVHSVADILRILRSGRPQVQLPWTMYAESTA